MILNTLMQEQVRELSFDMSYFDQLELAMKWLGEKEDTVFIGQAVACAGTGMYNTLKNVVKKEKLYEIPVAEDMQMGMTLGIAMAGSVPISIYPRLNFLMCGINQLVNHIDKFNLMAPTWGKKNIIIRSSIGSERPLFPQHQHVGDLSKGIELLAPNINIVKLTESEQILEEYKKAFLAPNGKVTLLIEYGDFYNEK